jgi:hypothetical protein
MSDLEFGELTEAERALIRMIRNVVMGYDFELRIRGDFGRTERRFVYFVVSRPTAYHGTISGSGSTFDEALAVFRERVERIEEAAHQVKGRPKAACS